MNKFLKITLIIIGLLFIFPINSTAQENQLEPVVIIPGITGSWNWEVMLQRSGSGTWDFFVIDHTWDNMIDALKKAGYEKDKTLFIAFYDWRQSNINSATDYLIPTIDKALLNSSTGKVNIVAHSMGGLVARRYIESNNYRRDVNHLVLLGTPNSGSSDVYTLWEGGIVPDNWEKTNQHTTKFYLWYMTTATTQTSDNYDTVRTYIPSIKEMLPTYDFLVDSDGETKYYDDLVDAKNYFLDNLNSWSMGPKLQEVDGITVIAGKGEGTVEKISVVDRSASETKLWKDGMPEPLPPERNSTEGDNRVLLSSAYLNPDIISPPVLVQNLLQRFLAMIVRTAHAQYEGFLEQKEITSKHGELPTTAISDVFTALALTEPTVDYVSPPEPDNITSFWFASPVQVKVVDPQGRVVTKDINEIPGAVYTGESDLNGVKMIIIPNSSSGRYKLELTGTGDGEYHMAAASFTNTGSNIVTTEDSITEGEKVEYTVNVDNENPENLEFNTGVTKDSLIADVNKAYDLGWVKNQGIRDDLIFQINKIFQTEGVLRKNILKSWVGSLKMLADGGKINQEAYNVIKADANWLILNS